MNVRTSGQAFDTLVEMLNCAHPRTDMSPVVDVLESRFLTGYSLFNADALLLECSGLDPRDALLVSRIQDLNRYMAGNTAEKVSIGTLARASQYLISTMSSLNVEEFHLLCVNAHGHLAKRVILERGTEDTALFSMKDLVVNAVRNSPRALILAHNHPRRTLRPSQEDLNCTLSAIHVLRALGIPLLDHIIIAGKNAVSIRDNGFISAGEWLKQAPENRLLRGWLGKRSEND